jgi:hypothetical protein
MDPDTLPKNQEEYGNSITRWKVESGQLVTVHAELLNTRRPYRYAIHSLEYVARRGRPTFA